MAEHSLGRFVYRYIAGRRLDGSSRPGGGCLRRAVWRVGVPVAVCAVGVAYWAHPMATIVGVVVLAAAGGVRGGRRLRRAWRSRRFRAAYIRPVLAALSPALGDAPVRLHVDPGLGSLLPRLARGMSPAETVVRAWYGQRVEPVARWVPDRAMRALWAVQRAARPLTRKLELLRVAGDEVGPRIELLASVPYLTPEQRQYVSAVIGAKVPAGELVESWDQVGPRVTATWTGTAPAAGQGRVRRPGCPARPARRVGVLRRPGRGRQAGHDQLAGRLPAHRCLGWVRCR